MFASFVLFALWVSAFADNFDTNFFISECRVTYISSYKPCVSAQYTYPTCTPWNTTQCEFVTSTRINVMCRYIDCTDFLKTPVGKALLDYQKAAAPTVTAAPATATDKTAQKGISADKDLVPSISTTTIGPIVVTQLTQLTPTMDEYCRQHYRCTEETKYSYQGCKKYHATEDPNCHLFCELEKCQMIYDRRPQSCTEYSCERIPPGPTPGPTPPGAKIWMWATVGLSSFIVAITIAFVIWRITICCKRRQFLQHRQLRGENNGSFSSEEGIPLRPIINVVPPAAAAAMPTTAQPEPITPKPAATLNS